MKLLIVESPTKAKTISKILPKEYKVESSFGHVRDLPQKEMGIDIEHDFEPKYVIPAKAKKHVAILKSLAERSDAIYFATDEDREGEAIAWHLNHILKPEHYKRIAFHEITAKAIEDSLKHPRDIDINLVNAQQARRILDRLVGYELSPLLWKKVAKGLSAGRVQSVTVRLIVEREREIENFKKEEYWTIEADFSKLDAPGIFTAKLHSMNGKALKKFDLNSEAGAKETAEQLKTEKYAVASIETKENKKKVPEPFKTSTLQQDAHNKLGFSSKETMMLAQQLYEGINLKEKGSAGLITYMRTDSLNLSNDFLSACREYIANALGANYAAVSPRKFKTKSKGAQEAHEAIRPTHVNYDPESIKQYLTPHQFKLYDLIWRRTVASQMAETIINSTSVDIVSKDKKYLFRATGQTIKFDGFQKIYRQETKETILPLLAPQEALKLIEIKPEQHFTEPPPRYNDASLVKTLEEYGIGRPSTYAPTISTIQERNYIIKEEQKFKPTELGIIVNDLLVAHFPNIVDYQFTAKMENELDEIALGEKAWQPIIKEFYIPFKELLVQKNKELSKKDIIEEEKTDEKCEKCGAPMVIKFGKFGKFIACSAFPECKNTKPVNNPNEPQEQNMTDEKCEKCGAPLVIKRGKYGKFFGCSKYPECAYIKTFSQNTGVACPICHEGELVSRKSRGKRIFYACNKYPKCKFILPSKPTGEKCPICQALLMEGAQGKAKCSNSECEYNKK